MDRLADRVAARLEVRVLADRARRAAGHLDIAARELISAIGEGERRIDDARRTLAEIEQTEIRLEAVP